MNCEHLREDARGMYFKRVLEGEQRVKLIAEILMKHVAARKDQNFGCVRIPS